VAELRKLSADVFNAANEEIINRRTSFNERMQEMAEQALDEMERLLVESTSEGIRYKAAQDILDRDGRAPRTSRQDGKQLVMNVDLDTLMRAAAAMDDELGRTSTGEASISRRREPLGGSRGENDG